LLYRVAADAALLLHLAFILFATAGGVLARWWRWVPAVQLPAAAWGAYVELAGAACPLTDAENRLRALAGQAGYAGSFVEHYLLGIIYPAGLTGEIQFLLAGGVLGLNLAIYGWLIQRGTWGRRR